MASGRNGCANMATVTLVGVALLVTLTTCRPELLRRRR